MTSFSTIEIGLEQLKHFYCNGDVEEYNEVYLPLLGKHFLSSSDPTDLGILMQSFLLDSNPKRVCVLFGDGGSGKSTFLKSYTQKLWRDNDSKNPIPVLISLPLLDDPITNAVEETFTRFGFSKEQIMELKRQYSFAFFLDGYDELHQLKNLYRTNHLYNWNAKTVITCRTQYLFNKKNADLYFMPFQNDREQLHLLQTYYIAPFDLKQIQSYLAIMTTAKAIPTYADILAIPELLDIVTTPFLLRLAVEYLPDILSEYQGKLSDERRRLTQTELLKKFVSRWFERQEKKLIDSGHITSDMVDQKPLFLKHCQTIAKIMNEYDLTWLDSGNPRFTSFFANTPEAELLRSACPLRVVNNKLGFWHSSLQVHFVGQCLCDDAAESTKPSSTNSPNVINAVEPLDNRNESSYRQRPVGEIHKRLMTENIDALSQWSDDVETNPRYKAYLFDVIERSKLDENYEVGAANAISILNYGNISFSGMNFQGIRIPRANLIGAILDHTNLSNANIQDAQLQNSFLNYTNLCDSHMDGVSFGGKASVQFVNPINFTKLSLDGKWFAVLCTNSVYVDMKNTSTDDWRAVTPKDNTVIESIAFCNDNKHFAAGNVRGRITLFEIKKDRFYIKRRLVNDYETTIYALCFSSNGKYLASGGDKSTVELWSLAKTSYFSSHKHVKLRGGGLDGFRGEEPWKGSIKTWCVVFSPCSNILASAGDDQSIRLWDTNTCEPLYGRERLFGHDNFINTMEFSPNGKLLLSGGGDGTVRIWNVDTGLLLEDGVLLHYNDIYSIAFNPQGTMFAVGCQEDASIHLWRVIEDRNFIKYDILQGHEKTVRSLTFTGDGRCLISGSKDCFIRYWELDAISLNTSKKFINTKRILSLSVHSVKRNQDSGDVNNLPISAQSSQITNDILVSGSGDNQINLWTMNKNKSLLHQKNLHQNGTSNNWIISVCFSPDGKYLAVRNWDRYMFDSQGKTIVRVNNKVNESMIQIWDLERDECIVRWAVSGGHGHWNVTISPDGKNIAYGETNTACIADMNMLTSNKVVFIVGTLVGHKNDVQCVTFSSDSTLLAAGSRDKTISLWNIETKQLLRHFTGHKLDIFSLVFSPDGKWLVSTDGTRDVIDRFDIPIVEYRSGVASMMIWNVSSPDLNNDEYSVRSLHGHSICILQAAFRSDGDLLASGSIDKTIILLNTLTWQLYQKIELKISVLSVTFNSMDELIVGTVDQALRIFSPIVCNNRTLYLLTRISRPSLFIHNVHIENVNGLSDSNLQLLFQSINDDTANANNNGNNRIIAPTARSDFAITDTNVTFKYNDQQLLIQPDSDSIPRFQCFYPRELFSRYFELSPPLLPGLVNYYITAVAISPDCQMVVSGDLDGKINVWNLEHKQYIVDRSHCLGQVLCVAISPDGKMIATRSYKSSDISSSKTIASINLWDVSSGKYLGGNTSTNDSDSIQDVTFSPDGRLLAWPDNNAIVFVELNDKYFNQKGARTYWDVFENHTEDVLTIAFSPDGCLLASGSKDTTIKLWDLQTTFRPRGMRSSMNVSLTAIRCVAFSPNGLLLASGGGDNDTSVQLWSIASGGYVTGSEALKGHNATIISVSFASDGKLLASGSSDKTIRLWNVGAKEIHSVISLNGEITCLKFSMFGELIYGCKGSNSIHVLIPKNKSVIDSNVSSRRPHENVTGIPGFTMKDMIQSMIAAFENVDTSDAHANNNNTSFSARSPEQLEDSNKDSSSDDNNDNEIEDIGITTTLSLYESHEKDILSGNRLTISRSPSLIRRTNIPFPDEDPIDHVKSSGFCGIMKFCCWCCFMLGPTSSDENKTNEGSNHNPIHS